MILPRPAGETASSTADGVNPDKTNLISVAIDRYGVKSIIDVGACWGVNGAYTFHALASGKVERAIIVDGNITSLTRERAARDARVELRQGNIGDAKFIDALPRSDAAIIFDVLVHQVAPNWDEFLARYSRKVDHFIIFNPDWSGGDTTFRFVERGLEWNLENVPDGGRERTCEWFARHDEWHPALDRPWRDVHMFWQWGIVAVDLITTMRTLGFNLDSFNNHGPWSDNYLNIQLNAYLFSRQNLKKSAQL